MDKIVIEGIEGIEEEKKEQVGIAERKNTYNVIYDGTELTFSGDFDSGNLNWVAVNEETNQIQIIFGKDKEIKPSAKCWFHFSISGEYTRMPVRLHLLKTNSLNFVAKIEDLYRPVVKVQGQDWHRLQTPVQFEISPESDISFRMNIQLCDSRTFYIANCYPWSLADNEKYLAKLNASVSSRKDIYFNQQTLIYSPENHPIHLIAISSPQVMENQPQTYIEHLFPNRDVETHFKVINKPLVIITSRVHPGEVGSSHSLVGMLDFLTGNSSEAVKILEAFYFLIVPILNPDGVFNGNNRMDSFGQNLNRFYLMPDLEKQPSCFAIKTLLENTRSEVFAFFDLHGHANKKSCFVYGNSIVDLKLQVESILFVRYLSEICEHVQFKSCNFSKKQMSSKDKNDDFSKEGCARVVVYKWTNSPYVYTLETGLYKNVRKDENQIQIYGEQFYTPSTYAEVGKKMLISLYAMFTNQESLEEMRKQVLEYVVKMQKQASVKKKTKKTTKKSKKEAASSVEKEQRGGSSVHKISESQMEAKVYESLQENTISANNFEEQEDQFKDISEQDGSNRMIMEDREGLKTGAKGRQIQNMSVEDRQIPKMSD